MCNSKKRGGGALVSRASLVKLPCASGDSGWEASSMMTRNDAVDMQQFYVLMTHFRFCPPKMMDTVTTCTCEFFQTLNQTILRGWLARLGVGGGGSTQLNPLHEVY